MGRINHSKLNRSIKAKSNGSRITKNGKSAGRYKRGRNDHLATDSQKKLMIELCIEFEQDVSKLRVRLLIFNELEERSKKT